MNKFFYFKIAFVAVSAGLFAGLVVNGLFDTKLTDIAAIGMLLLRSGVRAIITALFLGILNMYFKILPFQKKQD